jgi:NAD(P)-dependent dehydrogenase (short-subunit alcohol dehydrogenase family)
MQKIAVVTGGSSGIGQAAAIRIAQHGAGVVVTYNKNPDGGLETVSLIEKEGGTAVALPLDVGRSETFPAFLATVEQALADNWGAQTITGLVNNAGFGEMAMFTDTSEELFDRFLRVILKGPYFLTQTLLPLIEDGGSIVNTSSNSALVSGLESGYSAYASMKGGLIVLTRYLAKELSVRGIRVNSVAPGPTRTRIADDAFEKYPEVIQPIAARTALGRLGEADDLGSVIAFLLSSEAGWITAQDIEASGGFNL